MYSETTNVEPDAPQPAGILRSPKRSKNVAFNSAFADDGSSILLIGGSIDPKIDEDTNVSSLNNVYNSA